MVFFRTALWNISINSESFFSLRYKFIVSYALTCLMNWLLGIGDRHLSNTLVSLRNGEVISIDFGHAFGTATQLLPVPELVPFRLTPHIINIMQPFNEHGYFQSTMVHCLRVLIENKLPLLSAMKVFIQEPSIDWLKHAKKIELSVNDDENNWYPQEKISDANLKFAGIHPLVIFIKDIKSRRYDSKDLQEKILEYLEGVQGCDYRADQKREGLSPEQQVKCLIDQAIDRNLLGRMYLGWEPWI